MLSDTLDEVNRGILIFLSVIHFWSLLSRVIALHTCNEMTGMFSVAQVSAGCSCLGQEAILFYCLQFFSAVN